jgi:hypothetical protein
MFETLQPGYGFSAFFAPRKAMQLDHQLEQVTRAFINDPTRNRNPHTSSCGTIMRWQKSKQAANPYLVRAGGLTWEHASPSKNYQTLQ